MKIANASLQMAASHSSQQRHEVKESLNMWVGQQRADLAGRETQARPSVDTVTLSEAGQNAQSASAIDEAFNTAVDNDPRMSLIRTMLEYLTGRKIQIFNASDLPTRPDNTAAQAPANQSPAPNPSAGFGIEFDQSDSYSETEQTSFSATGTVNTADGRKITFTLDLAMARSYHEERSTSVRLGDAVHKTDPLVLNFSGNAAQLTNQRFAFDLDADGQNEQINFVAPGSGFLVFDRNRDGKINNGSELFGPTSGDGFDELAGLDSDSNGWIDENDAAFTNLQIWSRDSNGREQLQSLSASGVGAIALKHISTPFDLKNDDNKLLGQIRTSGIFLQDNGATDTIQQIDLTA